VGTIIACIGAGNMGFALMRGIAGAVKDVGIGFADADMAKAQAAAAELGGKVYNSNAEAVKDADYVFLAVKPQMMDEVLKGITPAVRERLKEGNLPVLVSMAAGWSIDKIQARFGFQFPPVPAARTMPNTPALISKGMIALAVSPEVAPEKTAELKTLLASAGAVDIVPEHYLDAITGLSGSGPAFAYMFIEALADGGVLAGLPRDKALLYAANTVLGSAAMVLETGKHPGELKDMVCSPGGTTIAGVAALEAGSFRSTVIRAVQAAWQRAGKL